MSATTTCLDLDDPTRVAQCALAHWNTYSSTGRSEYKEAFMAQASWLLHHETRLAGDTGGWPIHLTQRDAVHRVTATAGLVSTHEHPCSQTLLSATTQSQAISVLTRAYQLTGETEFLHAAGRAVQTFTLDILDKGVAVPVGEHGIFFEELAMYPAAHTLKGHLSALVGLYDYAMLTKDCDVEALIGRGLTTLHTSLHAFDSGYWTYSDLLHRRLASRLDHCIHVTLLKLVATYSGSEHCAAAAKRWHTYQHSFLCRSRYLVTSCTNAYCSSLTTSLRRFVFRTPSHSQGYPYRQPTAPVHGSGTSGVGYSPVRVCTPITAFPIQGGMRSVLAGVTKAMGHQWHMQYLTHYKGQDAEKLEIETFGSSIAHPWQFPAVWFYCLAGGKKLFTQLCRIPCYDLILPQDGTFTAAFAALLGKIAGIRVVCMDHGNVTWVDNPAFWRERMKVLQTYPHFRRFHARLRFCCYWASLRFFAMLATRLSDQFLVAGDEVEAIYRQRYGVHPARIMRYTYMVDVDRFAPCSKETRASMRLQQGIPADAIILTMINRLEVEKGLPFALEGIAQALPALSPALQARVKVLIVGDGSLRSQVETAIQRLGLASVCTLWGEASPSDVVMLLQISDIFLYSGIHGSNYSMAILEAMAAGCAVIASTIPGSNIRLLAEGRGIAISPANPTEIGMAFTRLCHDLELCSHMGQLAREYVATYHSPLMLQRSLLRASFFAPSLQDAPHLATALPAGKGSRRVATTSSPCRDMKCSGDPCGRQDNKRLKVCMHVLGIVRTDARVMREATALLEAGFVVTIIDVESDRTRPREEVVQGAAYSSQGTHKGVRVKHIIRPGWFVPTRFKPWFLFKAMHMLISSTLLLMREPADIYHAHDETALPACYIAARLRHKPLIFDAHELPLSEAHVRRWRWLHALAEGLLARMIPYCEGMITVSPPIARELHHHYHGPQVSLIRNVPKYQIVRKSDRLRHHLGLSMEVRIALYQGNLQPDRGLDTLIRAAPFLERDIVIVIMGKGSASTLFQLQAMIANQGLTDRVKILPPVPYDELLAWTASADIGLIIYPPGQSLNVRMCLPNKLFEYLMAGLPVLASQLDAIEEVIKTYHVGHIVSSLTPEDVAAAINHMLVDAVALSCMRRNALNTAEQEFCWEKESSQLIQLYDKILWRE